MTRAEIVQAEADLNAKESEYEREKAKLEKLNHQIEKCRIISPVDGLVVYATTGQIRWRGDQEPLQEGKEVREGEELIHIPKTNSIVSIAW